MKKVKNDIKLESTIFIRSWKIIVFLLLILVEILIGVINRNNAFFEIAAWQVEVPVFAVLTIENAVKMWGIRSQKAKIPFYVFDTLALIVLTLFTDGDLVSTLYIVILSEFYLTEERMTANIAMGASSVALFLIASAISGALLEGGVDVLALVSNAFNDLIIIVFHFLILNLSLQIYRKNREITKAYNELHASNEMLSNAYRELQEVTALEERQRIAKDIHDTAGHSITTVIMQTEAAKLILDTQPQEAKRRIAAANLQAKHALEELRESVHLLSGYSQQFTLKEELENIIHDSSDGTDISFRYEIEEITICDAKRRFLCNSLKEGIANGLRHGDATAFWFELKSEANHILFLLSDNGKGSELSAMSEGFGLSGMHSRAESLGGEVWFHTEKDEGFEIHITLPQDGI